MFLRQSTAQTIRFGPALDKTDGVTEETGLTLAQADMRLSKDGTAFAQKNASGNATHDSDGWYSTSFDTTDVATVGELILNVHQPANMLPIWMRFYVIEESIYDALFAASSVGFDSNQRVNIGQWLSQAVTLSVGNKPDVNMNEISDDSVAADNIEADYDGTGLTRANSTIGTVTTNTDMRGTDSAALASVVGALADAAVDGDPTATDTIMQYIKQLVNTLVGTVGIPTFPAEAAPANNVSLAEVIRAIHADVTGLNGDAMRGTDSGALASVATEARLAELDAANIPADLDSVLALLDDARTEPGQGAPPVNPDHVTKMDYLYKWARNRKDNDGTTTQFYADDESTVDHKQTTSEAAGTVTKTEIATGP